MNNYNHLIDFLKKYAPLSSLGALTYDGIGALTSATGTSLTVEKDKNYFWVPANGNALTFAAEANTGTTYHKANVLLDLSRNNNVTFDSAINCTFDSLNAGEVNLVTIEWYGANIIATLENAPAGEAAHDYVLSVKAMASLGNSNVVIAEACGNYWDTSYKNSACPSYTNGIYSLYMANGLGVYCLASGVADSDNWSPTQAYIDSANGNYGGGTTSLSAHEYVNGTTVWLFGKSAAPSLTASSGQISFVIGTAGSNALNSFYTATNATSIEIANSGVLSLPAGLSFSSFLGIPSIAGTPTGGESENDYSIVYKASNSFGFNEATATLKVIVSSTPAGPPDTMSVTTVHSYMGTNTYTFTKGSSDYNGKAYWTRNSGPDPNSGRNMYDYILWENSCWNFISNMERTGSAHELTGAGTGDAPATGSYQVSLGVMGDLDITISY